MAGILMAIGAINTVQAAAPALQGQIQLRPLTPQDIKDYSLTGLQGASGLNTIGVGQPAYLEVLVNNAVTNSDITNVVWNITAAPGGSTATLATSPLGTNVPPFKMADRVSSSGAALYKVASRRLLRPDITGNYTVSVTVQTASSGSTNLTQKVTAATYMGINTCALCHSGGILADDKYHPWAETGHATQFAREIDGGEDPATSHYGPNCIKCHTVGYDANTNAVNGGFDDVATQSGWTFPTNIAPGNWLSIQTNYPSLANLANIQCENCHGPGSEHAAALGNTNASNWPRLSTTYAMGNCAQCHDSKNSHSKSAEWNNSRHAVATRSPSGAGRDACVRCHTARGFKEFVQSGGTNSYTTNTVYEAITCAACHDPHDATNPHQLRAAPVYTLPEGTTVTNAGLGALCMQCHHSRNGSASNNVALFAQNKPTWVGGVSFGPHDSTAGEMIEGVGGIEYGKDIPSGTHNATITNVCVGCHMQPVASSDPAFTKAGGHTFAMSYSVVNNGVTNHVDKVDVCVKCHGPMEHFNMVRKDYNGDGTIEGIQSEVSKLLDKLSTLLPNSTYRADGNYQADGLVKVIDRNSAKTNWPAKFLNAAWNHMFVSVEGSHGIHNAPYAIGLLKASIADLTGDGNEDGLPDWWQISYFGSAGALNAAPNATPAGDGVPNWLKYALGLNPNVAGLVLPDGVVWANAGTTGGTNGAIRIYTAAEIVFDTEVGKSYQIQAVSTLGGGWQNIGTPIPGTGQSLSYTTPTRTSAQQFYRVVTTP